MAPPQRRHGPPPRAVTPPLLLLLLLVAAATPRPAASEADDAQDAQDSQGATLTCYSTLPTPPGQRPAVTPVAYRRKAGFEVCARYAFQCRPDKPECLAEEAATGTYKWSYIATSRANCRAIIAAADSLGARSIYCCKKAKCNVPDPRKDPLTQVVDDSWLTRSLGPNNAAAAPLALPGDTSFAAAPPRGGSGGAQPLACMVDAPGQAQAVAPQAFDDPAAQVCARYQFKCAAGNGACSAAQAKDGAWRWRYAAVSKSSCAALAANKAPGGGAVRNVLCCSASLCNKPDPNLDKTTKVVAAAAAAPRAAPLAATAGELGGAQVTCLTLAPPAEAPTARESSPGGGQATAEVLSSEFSSADGYETCGRYQYRCTADDAECSAADVKSGAWRWAFGPMSKASCAAIAAPIGGGAALGVRNVLCCSTPKNCNAPDRSLDKTTVVLSMDATSNPM